MSERIVWNSSLETGIRVIDLQHEELIGMLNELADAIARPDAESVLQDILRRLDAYILFHFSTEENLMRGQPGAQVHAEQHSAQHRAFVDRIASLKADAEGRSGHCAEALQHYLRSWLLDHIMQTDRLLGALLQESASRH